MSRRPLFSRALRAACAAVLLAAAPAAAGTGPAGADLAVAAANPAPAPDGGTTLLHPVVVNTGGGATAEPFTLLVHLPPGVVGSGTSPTGSCHTLPFGHTVACDFPAGLAPGATATAEVRIRLSSGLGPGVLQGTAEADLPGDPTPGDNTAAFAIVVL
ncbi:hypothetical protein ABT093_03240 [Kitasatospora sp. NPDC002551]|uniref:hypothetical protein n=1 Tax=unclassified Kitasatospora TaxID=2633591 RepID=UPI003330ECF5